MYDDGPRRRVNKKLREICGHETLDQIRLPDHILRMNDIAPGGDPVRHQSIYKRLEKELKDVHSLDELIIPISQLEFSLPIVDNPFPPCQTHPIRSALRWLSRMP